MSAEDMLSSALDSFACDHCGAPIEAVEVTRLGEREPRYPPRWTATPHPDPSPFPCFNLFPRLTRLLHWH